MRTVRVKLEKNGYDIYIADNLDKKIGDFFAGSKYSRTAVIVSDTNVGALYGDKTADILKSAGFEVSLVLIDAGEKSKSWDTAQMLYTRAIEAGLDRKSPVIALGGGVVGDITGFIASTYMRGVPFIQIPTSLLAHVDSSVGGKVAINHPLGKNLIGSFYQPEAVFIGLDTLKTLPQREIATGLAEIIKYGLIYDREFFSYIEEKAADIFALDSSVLGSIIARSCEIKADVVGKDERENGLRAILNFGHTLGHAVERETGYVQYNHGEAVAIGMAGAAALSEQLGLITDETVQIIRRLLGRCRLPQKCAGCDEESIYRDLFRDKKTVGGKINWVLLDKIGSVRLDSGVPEGEVRKAIRCIVS